MTGSPSSQLTQFYTGVSASGASGRPERPSAARSVALNGRRPHPLADLLASGQTGGLREVYAGATCSLRQRSTFQQGIVLRHVPGNLTRNRPAFYGVHTAHLVSLNRASSLGPT